MSKANRKGVLSLLLVASALTALTQPAFGYRHSWDLDKDKSFFGRDAANAGCPGPHYKSIWFKEHPTSKVRVCVDRDSVVRLANGGRARFVMVSHHGANSNVIGGKKLHQLFE